MNIGPRTIPVSFVLTFLLVFALFGCSHANRVGSSVTEDIKRQILSNRAQIDLAHSGTDFDWDTVLIFHPYYPPATICEQLKVEQRSCFAAGIAEIGDGEFLLVFLNKGSITRVEDFPRSVGDFDLSGRCSGQPIGKTQAQFNVEHRNGRVFLHCSMF